MILRNQKKLYDLYLISSITVFELSEVSFVIKKKFKYEFKLQ